MIHKISQDELNHALKRDAAIAQKHADYREKWINGDLYSSRDGKIWTSVPRSVLLTQIRNLKAEKNKAAHALLGALADKKYEMLKAIDKEPKIERKL